MIVDISKFDIYFIHDTHKNLYVNKTEVSTTCSFHEFKKEEKEKVTIATTRKYSRFFARSGTAAKTRDGSGSPKCCWYQLILSRQKGRRIAEGENRSPIKQSLASSLPAPPIPARSSFRLFNPDLP